MLDNQVLCVKCLGQDYHRDYSHGLGASRPEVDSWLRPLSATLLTSLGEVSSPEKWEY